MLQELEVPFQELVQLELEQEQEPVQQELNQTHLLTWVCTVKEWVVVWEEEWVVWEEWTQLCCKL